MVNLCWFHYNGLLRGSSWSFFASFRKCFSWFQWAINEIIVRLLLGKEENEVCVGSVFFNFFYIFTIFDIVSRQMSQLQRLIRDELSKSWDIEEHRGLYKITERFRMYSSIKYNFNYIGKGKKSMKLEISIKKRSANTKSQVTRKLRNFNLDRHFFT